MITIPIEHPGARYDILVGPVSAGLDRIVTLKPPAARLPVISDEQVYSLHGDRLQIDGLFPILVPRGEAAKQWPVLERVIEELAAMGATRSTPIIAFGGGSVGDVAGLAASLFKRGCPIVHIPTTLLAQVDSAIGGKTAIDACSQKNLVGTFHHPALVLADPSFFHTLDARQIRSGYAEIVKYGLIDDSSFFDWCEANGHAVVDGEAEARRYAIAHCIRAKARFVSADPMDLQGTRALLNFGHSFGHAIEALTGNDLPHGEAVAIGMVLAFRFSSGLGLCPDEDADRVVDHLRTFRLPTNLPEVGLAPCADEIMQLIRADKKAQAGAISLVLTRGIGKAFLAREVDARELHSFLSSQF